MKLSHGRLAALAPVALGAAAAIVVGSLAGGEHPATPSVRLAAATAAAAAPAAAPSRATATSRPPVIVTCQGGSQIRPSTYVIACADGNNGLEHLHWQTWGSTADATGTEFLNDCNPNCAEGTFYYFPATAVLWRPEPQPGHPGRLYFSRMTTIFTGQHCLPWPPSGQRHCLPLTFTYDLPGQQ